METIDDYSYGVIPLFNDNGVWSVFLINQFGHASDVYWTFPKGHKEQGETDTEAAVRELTEETGIILKQFMGTKLYEQIYSFIDKETVINKTVLYLLGEAATLEFSIQADEVKEARWFSLEEAQARLTFDNAKNMFANVLQDLKVQDQNHE